jgi:hypothetical protein
MKTVVISFMYPNLLHKVVGDLMIFMPVPRKLRANSYMDFANENLLISTLNIVPTDMQYDVFCWFERKDSE